MDPGARTRATDPEPESEPEEPDPTDDEADPVPEEPKELYVAVAALPGLAWKAAVAAGLSAALVGLVLGWEWSLLVVLPLVPISVALAVVDWRTRLLPTRVVAPTYYLTIAAVLLAWLLEGDLGDTSSLVRALLGWVAAGGLYLVLWLAYPRGMGYGDVRLSGVLGIALGFLGWEELAVGIYGGFLLGGRGRRPAGGAAAGGPEGLPVRPVHAARGARGRRPGTADHLRARRLSARL